MTRKCHKPRQAHGAMRNKNKREILKVEINRLLYLFELCENLQPSVPLYQLKTFSGLRYENNKVFNCFSF